MKYSLISPNEIVLDPNTKEQIGVRLCDTIDAPFEVAQPLFWIEVQDGISSSTHCYNLELNDVVLIPEYVPVQRVVVIEENNTK